MTDSKGVGASENLQWSVDKIQKVILGKVCIKIHELCGINNLKPLATAC